jgi:hypothetical protein
MTDPFTIWAREGKKVSDTQERRVVDHGNWAKKGVPHKGWIDLYVTDHEDQTFTCEMCKTALVRYVHTMEHPDYPEQLQVGCVCAENMSDDYVGPKRREDEVRNAAKRRKALADHRREVADLVKAKRELKRQIAAMGSMFRRIREAAVWVDAGQQMLAGPGLDEYARGFVKHMIEHFEHHPCYEPTERQTAYFVKLCKRLGVVLKEEGAG